jgi:hypothetical protein
MALGFPPKSLDQDDDSAVAHYQNQVCSQGARQARSGSLPESGGGSSVKLGKTGRGQKRCWLGGMMMLGEDWLL